MKKSFLSLVAVSLVLFFSASVVFATSFSDLTWAQKQKYWSIMSTDCMPLLAAKNYKDYRTCALNALETAAKYQENIVSWCTDDDGGANFTQKGIVKTDIKPNGIADYIYTFPNGKAYLMEGMCSNTNKYYKIQKNCSELGNKYHPDVVAGACVYVNNAPVFEPIGNKEVNEGEDIVFQVIANDADGDDLSYDVEGLPDGATFDWTEEKPEQGQFGWEPTYDQAGEYEVTFYVSDGDLVDKEVVKILVIDVEVCQWINSYGGVAVDGLTDVLRDSNGYYVSTGYFGDVSDGNSKIVLMKVDKAGVEQWMKLFQGVGGRAVIETDDGGYVIAGEVFANGIPFKIPVLIKTDENGNEQWVHYYGGGKDDFIWDVVQTEDGGYVSIGETTSFAQSTNSDLWVVKVDSAGGVEWQKTYGDIEHEVGYSIQQSDGGDYIITGSYQKPGSQTSDLYLLKLDNNGDKEWERTVGEGYSDGARSLKITSDGEYIVAGYTSYYGNEPNQRDAWLIKFDSNGNIMWDSNFDGGGDDIAFSVVELQDGGYVITGKTALNNGQEAVLLLKTDSDGNEEWKKVFNEGTSSTGLSIDTVDGTGYIIGGVVDIPGKSREMLLIKTDSLGSVGFDGCL